jgi:hypothetical protein
MHEIEFCARMFAANGADGASHGKPRTRVVNVGASESPLPRSGLLRERENLQVVTNCHALDEREQCRNDSPVSGPVDSTRHDQGNAHG